MTQSSLIALAAGGTGGHMFPAEALAQELKRRAFRVLLVTDDRGARFAEGFPADERFQISAASPSIGGAAAKAAAAVSIAGGFIRSLNEFRRRGVDAAVGFGGYPSLPAMKAAELMGLPYGVHEQNGVLGRANRAVVGKAGFLAHGFPNLSRTPAKCARRIEVGNPVRDAVASLAGAPYQAPRHEGEGEIRILVFGGSQGATVFSATAPDALGGLPQDLRRRLKVVQQAREADIENVRAAYEKITVKAEIAPFFKDLPERMRDAHLVIARAGASTVTELSVIGRPSILVPLPSAMDDHQTGNAKALGDAGAAILLPENDSLAERLRDTISNTLEREHGLDDMARAAKGRVKTGAARALADLVESVLLRAKDKKAAA